VCLLLHHAAPSRNTPLFSAEYLADREYNRTGTAPAALLKSASAGKLSDATSKGSSKAAARKHSSSSSRGGLAKPIAAAPASAASSANSLQDVELAYSSSVVANHGGSVHSSGSGSHSRDLQVLVTPTAPGAGGSAGGDGAAAGGRGLALPFTPMSVAFKDICYYVDLPGVSLSANMKACRSA
jgi:hypothetical protein